MTTVLVVDDEQGIREVLADILGDEGYRVQTAGDGIAALAVLERELVDCVLLDVWLPGKGGLEVLEEITRLYPGVPVILISGHGTIDMAVKAVKRGAFDFLEKPLSLDRVTTLVRNAIEMERLRRENATLKRSAIARDRIVGQSPQIHAIRELIDQTAVSDARVLITGENGTGKELVAREIHERSQRDGAFVAVNCAAIPDTLIETELFGHDRGAFTSAVAARKGKFEQAHGGTLFLDEVADMSPGAQAKVLRVLQELRIERVGGEESIAVDVRVIAATNRDINEEIREGRFRDDLFFRLNVVPIHMPPLRERRGDIPLLVDSLLRAAPAHNGNGDAATEALTFDGPAMERLQNYTWPGNVRELKNFLERVSIMARSTVLTAEDVDRFLSVGSSAPRTPALSEYFDLGLTEARDQFERRFLVAKLRANGYNISRTAQELGIYPSNLHAKIRKFGIEVER